MTKPTEFPNKEALYAANERRRHPVEYGYGIHWSGPGDSRVKWRVSCIQNTGEIYATSQMGTGHTLLLGKCPADPAGEPYRSLDALLEGHPQACLRREPAEWVRERLKAAGWARNC